MHGVILSLNYRNLIVSAEQGQPSICSGETLHPLLEVLMSLYKLMLVIVILFYQASLLHLLSRVKKNPCDYDFIRCFVRLLAAYHQFPKELLLDPANIGLLKDYCLGALKFGCSECAPLFVQNALDCCTLV